MKSYKEHLEFATHPFPINISHNIVTSDIMMVHPHWHDHVEILLVIRGSATQLVDSNHFDIGEGDIVIVPSNQVHNTRCIDYKGADILVLQFHPKDLIAGSTSFGREAIELFTHSLNIPQPIKELTQENLAIKQLLLSAELHFKNNSTSSKCMTISKIIDIMAICLGFFESDSPINYTDVKEKNALLATFNHIDEHSTEDIRLSDVAALSGYSVPQFCRLIKKHTAMTFVDYLNTYRVNKACKMILDGKMISNAAYSSGFNSLSAFNRAFKKAKSCSPTEWINRQH